MRSMAGIVLVAMMCVGLGPGSAQGATGVGLTGSYWYAIDNITDIQEGAQILLWVTVPPAWHGQSVKIGSIQPEPVALIEDAETGNTVIEWLVEPEPFHMMPTLDPRHFFFRYDFEVLPQPIHLQPVSGDFGSYDRNQSSYQRYTRAETWLQTDGEILDKAREITSGIDQPVARARALYDWSVANMEFVPGGRGERDARSILAAGSGDCEQFSLLYTAMCRSLGIPARTVTNLWPNETIHVFAEVLLPGGPWLPVDISVGQLMRSDGGGLAPDHAQEFIKALGLPLGDPGVMFGNLYAKRAIVTLGNNISVASPTLGSVQTFQRMRPGGNSASPHAIRIRGLNDEAVYGGFYVLGEQPKSDTDAHDLVHVKLADRYFAADRFDVVEEGCRASLEARPNAVKTWMNLGRVYMHKQEYYRAEAAFKRALKGGVGNPAEQLEVKIWTHNYLGNCYDLLGHRDMALKEYGIVLGMDNDFKGAVQYARKYQKHAFDKFPAKTGVR